MNKHHDIISKLHDDHYEQVRHVPAQAAIASPVYQQIYLQILTAIYNEQANERT